MSNQKDLSITTFSTVVVHKNELLKTLEVNRDKHNSIYEEAVKGYWIEAKQVLQQKQEQFNEALVKASEAFTKHKERLNIDFAQQLTGMHTHVENEDKDKIGASFALASSFSHSLNFNQSWPLKFPENHLEDYNRVIDMLKLSVADKVELSSSDFDAYVRNNWSWRSSFLNTNSSYAGVAYSGYITTTNSTTGMAIGNFISASGCYNPVTFARSLTSQF